MAEDIILRNEIQLYEVQDKKRLVERIKNSFKTSYGTAAGAGFVGAVFGYATVHQIYDRHDLILAGFAAYFALHVTGCLGAIIKEIVDKHIQIRGLETEIERIGENPAYRKLDSSE